MCAHKNCGDELNTHLASHSFNQVDVQKIVNPEIANKKRREKNLRSFIHQPQKNLHMNECEHTVDGLTQ